ncbi:putative tubby-like protein [Helianthus annuus]|nr:putative tubby-like protein [Helianthus annuus]
MGDRRSNRATLRDKFELEKFRFKVAKSVTETESSPSNFNQKQKSTETEEIVKHMKHLPSYLERGKPFQDRALSFGVMDWARLEKWQNQRYKHGFVKNIKCSPSSSYSSLFSADGSSPRSSRDQSRSPARPKVHRVTLQSHFKASPNEDFTPNVKSCPESDQSFQPFKDSPKQSCSKGKLKIQDEAVSNNNNPRKSSIDSLKNSGLKSRSTSPLRRFNFSLKSGTERADSPVSQDSNTDRNRSHSSPLRRLLDPIFLSKEMRYNDSRTKAKLDFENEITVDDGSSSSWKQALFQTTVKNERLLFTFAVENNKEILAATVTSLTSVKDNNRSFLYTFFTVHEVKKKTISWLTQGNKSKDHGYVPNVTAQMKVSSSLSDTREFVLFSVNPSIQPQEELEAVVVKFSRKSNGEDNQESFSTTVILPGGTHGVPSKGEPSPLVDRWRSGGVCDCGGWDVGCRLRTFSNQAQSSGSRSDNVHMTARQFELYSQGEFQNKRPIFSLSPLKEGIFSIDFNSSLSPLQAFSICISYVESRKMTQHTQLKTHSPQLVPRMYTPIPRIKKSVMGKVT